MSCSYLVTMDVGFLLGPKVAVQFLGFDNKELVLCYQIEKKYKAQKETLIPVLSFPTVDGEIYNHYRRGKFISGNLKN